MKVVSGGTLTKTAHFSEWPQSWTTRTWPEKDWPWAAAGYAALARSQPWVAAAVGKLARAEARLPLRAYQRQADDSRQRLPRSHPLSLMLRDPSARLDAFRLRMQVSAWRDIYGEVYLEMSTEPGGRRRMRPLRPDRCKVDDGVLVVTEADGSLRRVSLSGTRLIQRASWSPTSDVSGMSPLEPLRKTLETEAAMRESMSALMRNGGQPQWAIMTERQLSEGQIAATRAQWDDDHAGPSNTGRPLILTGKTDIKPLAFTPEDLAYIEVRKLTRDEVCGVLDVPPPALHILDRATFSNITEQLRSMYRDTMAPRLGEWESVLNQWVELEFGDDIYVEHEMDEVLRGDPDARMASESTAIQTAGLTPNERRRLNNLPPVEGGDQLLVQGALVPLSAVAAPDRTANASQIRTLMGRLGRVKTVAEIDSVPLLDGIDEALGELVLDALATSETVAEVRDALRCHARRGEFHS